MVRKKTSEQLSQRFLNELMRNSASHIWEEAKQEWEMTGFYYADEYRTCPCSSRGINNITVITNKYNSKRLEICISCAERHLGIIECTKIASSLNRIKKDRKLGMNEESIRYLLYNGAIPLGEFECYNAAKTNRNNERVIECREITNSKFINFTDYSNKLALEKIDSILFWAQSHQEFDLKTVAIIRNDIINAGRVNMEALEAIIQENGITESFYNKKDTEIVRKLIEKYLCTTNIDYVAHSKYLPSLKQDETQQTGQKKKIEINAEGLEDGFSFSDEFEEDESETKLVVKPLFENIDLKKMDSSIPEYCTPEDKKILEAHREEKRKFYNCDNWEEKWLKDTERMVRLSMLSASDKAYKRRRLEERMQQDELKDYRKKEMEKGSKKEEQNSPVVSNEEEQVIIRAEKVYALSSGDPIRIYGSDESMLDSQCCTIIKFTENTGEIWYGIFYGQYGKVSVSHTHGIILVLTSNCLYQLDKKTSALMELENEPGYVNMTVTPKGDFIVSTITDSFIEKITNNIQDKQRIKGPIKHDNIHFQSWNKDNLEFTSGGCFYDEPLVKMSYNSESDEIEVIDDGWEAIKKKLFPSK